MNNQPPALLLLVLDHSRADFLQLEAILNDCGLPIASLFYTANETEAKTYLANNKPDVVFAEIPDVTNKTPNYFELVRDAASDTAIIILSGNTANSSAIQNIPEGAQDYLEKGSFDKKLLAKTIVYSIERKRNIEVLRQANERYRLAARATNDLIWDWNLETGQIFRDEEATKKVYGISASDKIWQMHNWDIFLHPDDAERIRELILDLLEPGDVNYFESEYRILTDKGSYKNIYDRGYIVRDDNGKALRIIGAAKDITERKRLEKTLRELELEQQKAVTAATIKGQENEREQLAIELHDNINQVLATSKLYLDHTLTEKEVNRNTLSMSRRLIEVAMEEIRKLSQSMLSPAFEENGLVQALEELAGAVSITGRIAVKKRFGPLDESLLTTDQKLTLFRIAQEQVSNIIKHSHANNVKVNLKTSRNSGGSFVELMIKDNGTGFDTSLKRNGVGLRNITTRTELFGGTVKIKSSPGKGCSIRVIFPAVVH